MSNSKGSNWVFWGLVLGVIAFVIFWQIGRKHWKAIQEEQATYKKTPRPSATPADSGSDTGPIPY